ncbi:MAG: RNA 2',3'-cyclic phosphodiesterase [Spirochaetia bacterium]|nr:RNA 2',3'-cyclic phosphodiesterase [Spirochaetia bacterium]
MRLFVALELPEDVCEKLAELCHGLAGVRWSSADQFHLTLHFLGERENIEEIESALASLHCDSFPLLLSGVGRFVAERGNGAIWAGVQNSEPLQELHSQIGKALRSVGVSPEKRTYSPHVTLGRIQSATNERIHEYLDQFQGFQASVSEVTEFSLFSSRLRPEGPIHSIIQQYEFT